MSYLSERIFSGSTARLNGVVGVFERGTLQIISGIGVGVRFIRHVVIDISYYIDGDDTIAFSQIG